MIILRGQEWCRVNPYDLGHEHLLEGKMNYVKVKEVVFKNNAEYVFYHSMWKLRIADKPESRCIRRDIFEKNYFLEDGSK